MNTDEKRNRAIVIGAGPAGLTAAFELLKQTDVRPVVLEATGDIGGLSKTVNYKGNRIDIGGHRFFSKSDRIVDWWLQRLPMQGAPARDDRALSRTPPLSSRANAPDPERTDRVMLTRRRFSRIYFNKTFFDYPISLSYRTLRGLGPLRTFRVGVSYLGARLFPISPERSLEDFFINRFGRVLYRIFFRDYTEKVWGVSCAGIRPEWGAQRIKDLSVSRAVLHAARRLITRDRSIRQTGTETSLIEQFFYPKFGPGQMWEEVARLICEGGGRVEKNSQVTGIDVSGRRVTGLLVRDAHTGKVRRIAGDYFLSSMPVRELVQGMGDAAPYGVRSAAAGLLYRDFLTVGLLVSKMRTRNETKVPSVGGIIPDNWIYIQDPDVKIGRVQVFNNWSPYMVRDSGTIWLGLEYFCNEGDDLWTRADEDIARMAGQEFARLGFIDARDILDSVVIRAPKAYPAYFGGYDSFGRIRRYTDGLENLFLIGRNGMHRYNNQDHSMLTAMEAVKNIVNRVAEKGNIWDVNAEQDFLEAGHE